MEQRSGRNARVDAGLISRFQIILRAPFAWKQGGETDRWVFEGPPRGNT